MKVCHLELAVVAVGVVCSSVFAAGVVTTSTVDNGGQRASSASYVNDGSVGGIGGISSAAADTARNGYIGQLTEVVSMSATGSPVQIKQGATSQLSGTATLDDTTSSLLTGSDIGWGFVTYPFQSVDGNGLLTAAANVYANPVGNVTGSYLGTTSNASVQVLGPYANSGIPDVWLLQYFGMPPNPHAAPTADADGTGQNNLFKYVAGLDPTNAASVFVLQIASVADQPGQKTLTWTPLTIGRTYTPEYRTNLTFGSYAALAGYSGPQTNSTQVSATDVNAVEASKFYHIKISYP